jgi:hypothetical protein
LRVALRCPKPGLKSTGGLVDEDRRIRQRESFALGTAASRNAAMLAAIPTHSVDTSALMNCIVSKMAMPADTDPPGN